MSTNLGAIQITALGPFVIFGLQLIEGRVTYSEATLVGLVVYFTGAVFAALGAVGAVIKTETTATGVK